ncbi:methyltransferase domain-containing protein, partial [Salinispora arenicola]|uniref:methyltransferase domain-containing protein n=1 Tax=Salinispora arenicola TaxID=168697 RepID=UPI0027DDC2B4
MTLCEAADQPRRKLAARFAGNPKVDVVQPAALAELVDSSVDLMVVNSVVQYLRRDELRQLLVLARRLLTPDGRLVIGDVIPRRASVISEVAAILRLASRERFLVGRGRLARGNRLLAVLADPRSTRVEPLRRGGHGWRLLGRAGVRSGGGGRPFLT